MDLVSVITPAFNAQKYIAQTIESVLAQTYPHWEMIIVDDGSIDQTADTIKPFLKDNRIKYVYQTNGKQGKARNAGIKQAQGKYLAFLDADDLWHATKLQKQLEVFSKHSVDAVYSQGWIFNDEEGFDLANAKLIERDVLLGLHAAKEFTQKLLQKNQIPALSLIVKKNKVDAVNGFGEEVEIQNAEDYQLWLKLADSGCNFYGMEERLFYYRIHANQSTFSNTYAPVPSIWAIENLKLTSVSPVQKKEAMITMLKKNIMRDIDVADSLVIKSYVSLLNKPLRMFTEYFLISISFFFGAVVFKKTIFKVLFQK
jgi:teichuronic acid biosynthesis glycosyltransferase TuaG